MSTIRLREVEETVFMANLLLVDDNPDASRPLAMLLRFFKHSVDYVTSGSEALAYLGQKLPDLVVLDVMMPGMDGMEVLRRIRSDARTNPVPVIMFSAVCDPAYQQAALKKGADDYVVKGTEFEELRRRVEQWATSRHIDLSGGTDRSTTKHGPPHYH